MQALLDHARRNPDANRNQRKRIFDYCVAGLLALAMELASALALRAAHQLAEASRCEAAELEKQLKPIQKEITDHTFAIASLLQEGSAFKHRFWRDFFRSATDRLENAAKDRLPLLLLALLVLPGYARATDTPCVVVAVDLTMSEETAGPDGKSGLEKNLDAVAGILAQVPAGT